MLRRPVVIAMALACSVCSGPHNLTVEFYIENGYRFSQAERRTIERIADATIPEVRRHLPALANDLVLKVYPGTDVIPETGEAGSTALTDRVFWIVHPHRPDSIVEIANRELRGTLFHELHHLARSQIGEPVTLMTRVVAEGLATVFERDGAGMSPPWGQYPSDVSDWVNELLLNRGDYTTQQLLYRHPDGRRWMGMKTGTYIADQAIRASGRSAAELATVPTTEVLRLAGIRELPSASQDR
jgi:uncharacterized protein YjaZ